MSETGHADCAGAQMESELDAITHKLAALKRQLAEREPVVERAGEQPPEPVAPVSER